MRSARPSCLQAAVSRGVSVALGTGANVVLVAALGCGEGQGGDVAAVGGRAGADGNDASREVAEVRIESGPLVGNRLGQRWRLGAIALDASAQPIAEAELVWSSSDPSIADVDPNGVVTAMRVGAATITAAVGDRSDSVELAARATLLSDRGETWFAQSDGAALAIVGGRLETFPLHAGATPPEAPWPHPSVARFEWSGDRVAIVTDVVNGLGTLRVLERNAQWVLLRVADAKGFQLEDDWIAELDASGALRISKAPDGPWTTIASRGVTHFRLVGGRITALDTDGNLRFKDGIDGDWTTLATGVRSFELHGDRVAALFEEGDGRLRVTDGVSGSWTTLEDRVTKVALSGERIGALRKDGVAWAQHGIDGERVELASSYVEDLQLADDRVAIQFEGGIFGCGTGCRVLGRCFPPILERSYCKTTTSECSRKTVSSGSGSASTERG